MNEKTRSGSIKFKTDLVDPTGAGAIMPAGPLWRNWQTRQIQNLLSLGRPRSSRGRGTNKFKALAEITANALFVATTLPNTNVQ